MKLNSEEIAMLHTALDVLTGVYDEGLDSAFVRELVKQYQSESLRDKARVLRKKLDQESLKAVQVSWDQNDRASA